MTPDDLADAERLSAEAFLEVDRRTFRRDWPEPERRSPERGLRWMTRAARLLTSDPGGCWAAEDADGLAGFATSMVRERLWVLATFAVRPDVRGQGVGRRLLTRAEGYGAGCDRAILAASEDPPALRRYHASGFALHPQLLFTGTVEKSALPAISGLREGTSDDLEWMDELDRHLRGGPHGPDHDSLREMGSLMVTAERSGYAYAETGSLACLAARDADAATRLLWECLARSADRFDVPHVTTANPWAVDVAMRARLTMSTNGFLAVRGMTPPATYVPNGALL